MIVVTGATGNIGKLLVPKLAAAGVKARLVTRDPDNLASPGPGMDVVKGSVDDTASIKAALEGAEKLFLLAPASPVQSQWECAIIDAAKSAGVKHIVMISAIGAAAESPIMLARGHAAAEAHLKASGVAWTILQPHFFMQNVYLSMPTIKAEGTIYNSNGDGKFSPVDADDIAAVAVACLSSSGHESKTYLLTGPEAISFPEIATKLGQAANREIKHVSIPEEAYAGALQGAGLPDWLAKDLAMMSAFFGTGQAAAVSPDVNHILGRNARSMDDFARDHGPAFA